jgi:hypothetical protein
VALGLLSLVPSPPVDDEMTKVALALLFVLQSQMFIILPALHVPAQVMHHLLTVFETNAVQSD